VFGAAGRIDPQELRRRVWHMAPGLLPFLLWPISHRDPLSPTIRLVFFGIFVALTAAISWNWRRIAREGVGDRDRLAAVYGYAGSVLLMLLAFPAHAECGLALLGVLAFGDGAATLFGKLVGGPRLPWNGAKSVAGLCGFLLVGVPVTAAIYWGESHNLEAVGPGPEWGQALFVAMVGVAAGAIAESVPSRVNDNIRVGLAGAVGLLAAHGMVFGL
jgi:dolichol kinase